MGPQDCIRLDCVTCNQGDEKRIDCRKRNVLYESECILCKEVKKDGKRQDDQVLKDGRGVNVGESSCSIYVRAKEHVADREKQAEDSHQIKHWITSHEELLAPPKFVFKIIKTFQDRQTRQLAEAVRIDLRGEDILNSKADDSRCQVPRLRVDMEGWKEKKKESMIVERAEQEVATTRKSRVMPWSRKLKTA